MKKFKPLIFALAATLLAGCGKKDEAVDGATPESPAAAPSAAERPADGKKAPAEAAEAPANDKLPGASGVRKDLASKNWMGAVEGLLALKQMATATGGDAFIEWRTLGGEVGLALQEASTTDQKAAQALGVYRIAMYGR